MKFKFWELFAIGKKQQFKNKLEEIGHSYAFSTSTSTRKKLWDVSFHDLVFWLGWVLNLARNLLDHFEAKQQNFAVSERLQLSAYDPLELIPTLSRI